MLTRGFLFLMLSIVFTAEFAAATGNEALQTNALEPSDRLKLFDGNRGVSCSQFMEGVLPWKRRGGDWRDSSKILFGEAPFAVAKPIEQAITWDVSTMVRGWAENGEKRGGFFLRPLRNSGYARFHSREARNVTDWPMLVLELSDGHREILKPTADSSLDCSSSKGLGGTATLDVSGQHNAVLQFDLPLTVKGRAITRAKLILSKIVNGGAIEIGVFAMATPNFPTAPVETGLALEFPLDREIKKHPDVIFVTGFDEAGNWKSQWAKGAYGETDIIGADVPLMFTPIQGPALRANLKKGSNLGFEARLYLKDHGGEPDELYFRYYLRLANDWNPNLTGGKLPGIAGTYGEAGWGGRRVDGSDGWSLRGSFAPAFSSNHPMSGLTQLGTYAYHAEMSDFYGDLWIWPGALLARNRWYSIEQYVRMNRPGVSDGNMRVWVDGRLVMDRTKMRLRNVDRLHIETVWLNAYHGGAEVSPHDQHLYIDNVVVARSYIGPMATPPALIKRNKK